MCAYRVLIVEDAPIVRHGLELHLRQWGVEHIDTATTGQEALAKPERPDLLIVSTALPGHPDGLETARLLQQQNPPVPVLLLHESTNQSVPAYRPPLTRCHCLPSPPTVEELHASLAEVLRG
ncbi:response regulator [Hymenobacter sp. BT175]|uniref:response regulator transcription factor n=1 Tax=Hymenobacter translucens TaxID=2886507 RepID=UPI001D0EF0BD|nr:response regulator [Hymenobacter translucens]MCC2548030.1 response regulator [Hymenobacter translucens]